MDDQVHVLIVEDEGIVAMGLEDTLKTEGYGVAGIVEEGKKAIQIIEKEPVDIVLLDIHIKGDWDGIETARQIMSRQEMPFIFLTAFSDRSTIERAKEIRPAAYLTKPYQSRNLLVSIEIALNNFACRRSSLSGVPMHTHFRTRKAIPGEEVLRVDEVFFIKQNYSFVKVNRSDIYYIETEGNYIRIVTVNKKYLLRHALASIIAKLDHPNFVRVHRSYVINIGHLETFNDSSVFVGSREIPLGRNYKEAFFNHFNFL